MIEVLAADLSEQVVEICWEADGTTHPYLLMLDGQVIARARSARELSDWALWDKGAARTVWRGKTWAKEEERQATRRIG
jgi:hypothetical protein